MTFLSECNPITAFFYFLAVVTIPMLTKNPVIAAIAVTGAFACSFLPKSGIKKRFFYVFLLIILTIINPLFSHKGKTVLFLLGDVPFTLESIAYGAAASLGLVSILLYLSAFSKIMKSDRLLYLFGLLSPKLALTLSTTIRFIPLFLRRAKEVEDSGRVMGLYRDDNIVDTIKGKLHVFSVMITWMLEDGILTADSMAARGYGIGKRTSYSIYSFTKKDAIYIFLILCLILPTAIISAVGNLNFEFYPEIIPPENSVFTAVSYITYSILTLLPVVLDLYEEIKWKYLKSKI